MLGAPWQRQTSSPPKPVMMDGSNQGRENEFKLLAAQVLVIINLGWLDLAKAEVMKVLECWNWPQDFLHPQPQGRNPSRRRSN